MQKLVDGVKDKLDVFFRWLALFFIRIGVSPNIMSGFCFIFGLIAVYFLFVNHFLFVIFMLLHLLADKLDGVIARATNKVSKKGEWLDYLIDTVIAILLLLKSVFYLNEFFVILVLFYFILHHGIFIGTRNRKYLVGSRTFLCVFYIVGWFNVGLFISIVASFIGMVLQIKMFLNREDKD
ncbi:CDP-alcohol phosphatidyltransferase family protein [Candidatus Woesearchaeota archaeon]|nr:CDP-alcohol phosphatidyltransferase family protein [Candidatus Woesearchaeota archaeon]